MSFRPLDPPPDWSHESCVEEQVHGDMDRRPCCREMITRTDAPCVCPFPRADRYIETTHRVRDTGEKGEVRSIQGRIRVRVEKQVEGLLPLAPSRGFACPFQCCRLDGFTHPSPHGGIPGGG